MQIYNNVELIDSRYHVQVDVTKFSALEAEMIEEFGDIIVDAGGNFAGSATRAPTQADPTPAPVLVDFTLATKHRRLSIDFPVKEIFDLVDDADSDIKAEVYKNEMNTRLQAARTALLANNTNFLGETLTTITN